MKIFGPNDQTIRTIDITISLRVFLLTVGQFTVYDQIKSTLRSIDPQASESKGIQFLASVLAGAVTTTLINPVRGIFHCFLRVIVCMF